MKYLRVGLGEDVCLAVQVLVWGTNTDRYDRDKRKSARKQVIEGQRTSNRM